MGKSITEITNEWKNSVNDFTGDVTNDINDKVTGKINDLFGGPASDIGGGYKQFKVDPIEFRSKLEMNCPDFLKFCNVSRIDFGTLFLSAESEQLIAQGTALANTAINTVNGIQNYLSPAALEAVQNLITFIITDLISNSINYATQVFLRYVSPEFPLGLATDITKGTLRYTQEKLENPADTLKRLCEEQNKSFEEIKKLAEQQAQATVVGKIVNTVEKTKEWLQDKMNEIQPYVEIINKYMVYGPDYACSEVAALYEKYFAMAISYVDEQVYKVDQMVHDYVDYCALTAGTWAANKINAAQERVAKAVIEKTEKGKKMLELKAMAIINKTTMNLLAMLGG